MLWCCINSSSFVFLLCIGCFSLGAMTLKSRLGGSLSNFVPLCSWFFYIPHINILYLDILCKENMLETTWFLGIQMHDVIVLVSGHNWKLQFSGHIIVSFHLILPKQMIAVFIIDLVSRNVKFFPLNKLCNVPTPILI